MYYKGNLEILVGISNSGKSTYAHQEWLKNPSEVLIVSRDKIRELLFGYTEETVSKYYRLPDVKMLEKQVTAYHDTLIHQGLRDGFRVIVDAIHLDIEYIKKYEFWNVPTKLTFFNIAIEDAVNRDMKRTRKVGHKVLLRQRAKFDNLMSILRKEGRVMFEQVKFDNNPKLYPAVIFDIDGTLSEKGDREPFDWNSVGKDKVILDVKYQLLKLKDSEIPPKIIICTGRMEVATYNTKKWLKENGIPYDTFYIRKANDYRPDYVVKEEMWRDIAKRNYIAGIYDDRMQVIRRARALGLTVFDVAFNNF